MTRAQLERFDRAAQALGLSRNAYMRARSLEAAAQENASRFRETEH